MTFLHFYVHKINAGIMRGRYKESMNELALVSNFDESVGYEEKGPFRPTMSEDELRNRQFEISTVTKSLENSEENVEDRNALSNRITRIMRPFKTTDRHEVKHISVMPNLAKHDMIKYKPVGEITGRVNVYVYKDVCSFTDTYNLYWHPLFPKHPHRIYHANKLEDEEMISETFARRFMGYLHVHKSGNYTFQMQSRNGIDVVIFDNEIKRDAKVARFGIYKTQILEQMSKNPPLFTGVSRQIFLSVGRRYVIDIAHVIMLSGKFLLRFKMDDENDYKPITGKDISPHSLSDDEQITENPYFSAKPRAEYTTDGRFSLNRIQLHTGAMQSGFVNCPYTPNYLYKESKMKLYYGQVHVQVDLIYPDNKSGFTTQGGEQNRLLNETIAKKVAEIVFHSINKKNNG